jgi:hypothetical protein
MMSDFDLLLTGFRMGKLSGVECFQEIDSKNLWPSEDELATAMVLGREAARTRDLLAETPVAVRDHVSSLLRAAEASGHVNFDARRFIERLFGEDA